MGGGVGGASARGRLHPERDLAPAEGWPHLIYPGVYAVGNPVLRVEGRLAAALLYAGKGAALSHTTAAFWWELTDSLTSPIHVTASGRHRRQPGLVIHRTTDLHRVIHRNLPVTTPARTLLDLAGFVPLPALRQALAAAEYRGRLHLDQVEAQLRRGHRGSTALREALDRHRPQLAHAASELERELIYLCERHSIPLPECNVFITGFKVDALWRAERLVVEVDGAAAHGTPGGLVRDRDRDLALRRAGFMVLRYTWSQVKRESRSVAEDLRRALQERRAGR